MKDKLFSFIYKEDNNLLSKMNKSDLQELINLLLNYKLEYRDLLDLDRDIRFGAEVEFEFADKKEILEKLLLSYSNKGWYAKPDKSLFYGLEIVSPILTDDIYTWVDLKDICTLASENGSIQLNSGGHIHVDNRVLKYKKENLIKLLKVFAAYENVIFRFGNGEYLNPRPAINRYAEPIAEELYFSPAFESNDLTQSQIDGIIYQLKMDRFKSLNITNASFTDGKNNTYKNTVEFRYPNGTLNPIIWQNNINFNAKLTKYASSKEFDEEKISKRILSNIDILSRINEYNKIDLDGALELADLIFDNNLDKLYFLRQYIKDYKVTRSKHILIKSKEFTK